MSSSHYISSLLTSQLYTIFSNNGYFFCKNHAEQKIYKINYTYWTKKLGLIWWIIKTFSFNFVVCRRRKLNLTLDILEKRLDMTQYDLSLVVKVPTQLNGYTPCSKTRPPGRFRGRVNVIRWVSVAICNDSVILYGKWFS